MLFFFPHVQDEAGVVSVGCIELVIMQVQIEIQVVQHAKGVPMTHPWQRPIAELTQPNGNPMINPKVKLIGYWMQVYQVASHGQQQHQSQGSMS